jgi:DNA recombination protein RmuC
MFFIVRHRAQEAAGRARAETLAEQAKELGRLGSLVTQFEDQRKRGEALQAEIRTLNDRLLTEAANSASARRVADRVPELVAALSEREARMTELQNDVSDMRATVSELNTSLADERAAATEKIALLDEARLRLTDTFRALSAEVLRGNSEDFLKLARGTLEGIHKEAQGDLDKRQQAIATLVEPVRQSLEALRYNLDGLEKARIGNYSSLATQMGSLLEMQQQQCSDTSQLVRALRSPIVRGKWGEIQLRRVVELAGMVKHCDFFEQMGAQTEDGRLIPDLIVKLPGGRNVVVDAKTPLSAYLEALEETDDEARKAKLWDHAAQVRKHVVQLSQKSYWEQFQPTPEFVILFLPGESFFSAALEQDPSLIEFGVERRILLATPTTLIALLSAVYYGWRQEQLAQNAQEISNLGRELHKRLSDCMGHWTKLGRALGHAVGAYNDAVGSLESRVLVSARRFRELGASVSSVEIDMLNPLDHTPRAFQAPELVAAAELVVASEVAASEADAAEADAAEADVSEVVAAEIAAATQLVAATDGDGSGNGQ